MQNNSIFYMLSMETYKAKPLWKVVWKFLSIETNTSHMTQKLYGQLFTPKELKHTTESPLDKCLEQFYL